MQFHIQLIKYSYFSSHADLGITAALLTRGTRMGSDTATLDPEELISVKIMIVIIINDEPPSLYSS
jgi:hypothetical protein